MDDAGSDTEGSAPDGKPAPLRGGASSRLPWRYAGPGGVRLRAAASTMSAGRGARPGSKVKTGSRRALDVDDHIRHAIREESAATLGRAGSLLQEAVAALAEFDRGSVAGLPAERRPLLIAAAGALWHYVVQREAMGLTNHDALEQVYGVTPELWSLMGSAEVVCRKGEQ